MSRSVKANDISGSDNVQIDISILPSSAVLQNLEEKTRTVFLKMLGSYKQVARTT